MLTNEPYCKVLPRFLYHFNVAKRTRIINNEKHWQKCNPKISIKAQNRHTHTHVK